MEQLGRKVDPGTPQRMTQGDGTAIYVQPIRIDAQIPDDLHGLGRERLIQFDEADIQGSAVAAEDDAPAVYESTYAK